MISGRNAPSWNMHAEDVVRIVVAVLASVLLADAAAAATLKATALKGLRASGTRVLVFAPHPDDEVLGAGGLIRRVVAGDGQVRVVFVTSGDGFAAGVTRELHVPHPGADDYRRYAREREEEAVRSLAALLPPREFPVPTRWVRFPLGSSEAALKREAVAAYRTQMDAMAGYLMSFARSNVLFVLDAERVPPDAERRCCAPSTSLDGN